MGCSGSKSTETTATKTALEPTTNGHTKTETPNTKAENQTESLSDFQKKKLGYIFHIFYDVDKDDKVDWADFACTLEKICKLNNWEETNPRRKQALSCLETVWTGLQKYADKNSDGEISMDEWFQMWADCEKEILADKTFPEWLNSYMEFMFDAADTSGDGIIDKDEFRLAYTSFGLSAEACDSAFDIFSQNATVELTKEMYGKLWQEFFLSNDPEAKGNYLFGEAAIA